MRVLCKISEVLPLEWKRNHLLQFSKLKKSERYETLEEACRAAAELDSVSVPETSDKNQNVGEASNSAASKPIPKSGSSSAILVSPKQRGNPLLKSIINVPWEYDESIIPDYVIGRTTCALFLSLRYHTLKPDYIAERLKLLGKLYDLRVLLVQVDQKDPHHALKHLTRICLLADLTLMLSWSAEEAGKIIETYKIFQNKPPDMIMERKESDPHVKLVSALSSVRPVNKTDATNLLSTFGSLKRIINASENALSLCPGFGSNKASRLHKLLHQPFLKTNKPTNKTRSGVTKFLKSTDS